MIRTASVVCAAALLAPAALAQTPSNPVVIDFNVPDTPVGTNITGYQEDGFVFSVTGSIPRQIKIRSGALTNDGNSDNAVVRMEAIDGSIFSLASFDGGTNLTSSPEDTGDIGWFAQVATDKGVLWNWPSVLGSPVQTINADSSAWEGVQWLKFRGFRWSNVDNIVIVPAPGAASLLAVGALALTRRRR
ncbi:MAG: hypothetical protein RIG82_05275 [Phycisphaeraceae bacterium]